MQTEPTDKTSGTTSSLGEHLEMLQCWLLIAFAASLSLPITIPWIILTVGIVVGIVQIAERIRQNGAKFALPPVKELPPLAVPIAALTLVYFLSGLANGGLKEAMASIGVMRSFLVYFWAYYAFRSRQELLAKISPALLLFGAMGGVAATVEHQFHLHISSFKYLQGTGFLSGPMAFAGVMQMLALLALSFWLTGSFDQLAGQFKKRTLFVPIALGNILGIIFAFERSAWLGFSFGAMLIASLVSRKLALRVLAIGVVIALLGWFALPAVQARMGSILRGEQEESSRQRMQVWTSAIEQYNSSLRSEIIGVGPRKFQPVPIEGPNKEVLDHAHSNYLQSLTTTGVVGLLVYLWLSIASLRLAWQNFRKARVDDRLTRGVSLGVLGGIVSLMIAGIFEYNFGTGNVRLAQWFLLALLSTNHSWLGSFSKTDIS
ncbi:MAG TPA: O-antigen ligase family protein [Drouetiella sp.]|jgi:O-antigen ligase